MSPTIQGSFERILAEYESAKSEPFGKAHPMWSVFEGLAKIFERSEALESRPEVSVAWAVGQGNWARVPWISFLHPQETLTTQEGVYGVYLFRADQTAVYVTLNQGVTQLKGLHGAKEARRILEERAKAVRDFCTHLPDLGFQLDNEIDLRAGRGLGKHYEHSTIAHKRYDRGEIPNDDQLLADLDGVLQAYDRYLGSEVTFDGPSKRRSSMSPMPEGAPSKFALEAAVHQLIQFIESKGFFFEPWHVAEYVTAIRTKPFAILAGVSGTGKSKLPALVAEGTGAEAHLVPVRPDWTDSADVLGYVDLQGDFRPGRILELLHQAMEEDDRHWVIIIDEMNLARVEQYLAEVLSKIEDRRAAPGGGFISQPLLAQSVQEEDAEWSEVVIPSNVVLVGTVNMDETTHGFSRKVLDRAFTIELSDVDLSRWRASQPGSNLSQVWPLRAWQPRAISLSGLGETSELETRSILQAVEALKQINGFLREAQLQVGYRTRDEVALFLVNAAEISSAFVDLDGNPVDPLDLALHMKVLPRIVGGSSAVRRAVLQFLSWADAGRPAASEADIQTALDRWEASGRRGDLPEAQFPRTAARLCLMWERLQAEGYTSFWL